MQSKSKISLIHKIIFMSVSLFFAGLLITPDIYAQMPSMPFSMGGGSHHSADAGSGSNVKPSVFSSSAQGLVGVMLQNVNRSYYKLPAQYGNAGAYVAYVMSGMPAEAAGLKIGDIILEMDGQLVKGMGDFESLYRSASSDGRLSLKIFRDGKDKIKQIVLPNNSGSSNVAPSPNLNAQKSWGPQDIIAKMRPNQAKNLGNRKNSQYSNSQAPYKQNYPGMFIEDMINKSPIPLITGKRVGLANRNSGQAPTQSPFQNSPKARSLKSQVNRRLEISLHALKMKQELRLSESQEKELKAIAYNFRIQNIKDRAAMEIAKLELEQALSSEDIKEDTVKEMLENVAKLRIEHTISVIRMTKKAEGILKKVQIEKLKSLLGIRG